nr:putative glucose-6-phosphate 1-epimerase [Tanacetum cinerariifolium]GFA07217.1 putative glucose-6-phosphate 1-epimerase [Tanacetum cinerariifolium]
DAFEEGVVLHGRKVYLFSVTIRYINVRDMTFQHPWDPSMYTPNGLVLSGVRTGSVVWNLWDQEAKDMVDFGDEEYKHMLCMKAAAVEKPNTLKSGEEWRGRQELSTVNKLSNP